MKILLRSGLALLVFCAGAAAAARADSDLKIGLVGLDTSHVILLTSLLNDPAAPDHVPGGRIVCAYKDGSADMAISRNRIEGFTAQLRDRYQVELVDSLAELLRRCDAVVVMSVDGRRHLAEARAIFPSGKPVFLDKPLGNNLAEARAVVRLAQATHTPLFSGSPFRFTAGVRGLRDAPLGRLRGAVAFGNGTNEPHMPDLFYEAIHPVEVLYTILGPHCESVSCVRTVETDVVTGVWPGGRTGVLYALRDTKDVAAGAEVFGERGMRENHDFPKEGFRPLTQAIIRFFQTKESPVPLDETLDILTFLTAANQSHQRGGAPVRLSDAAQP